MREPVRPAGCRDRRGAARNIRAERLEWFTRPLPTLGVLVGYAVSFYPLSLVLEDLAVGLVYGTWSAVGIVGITLIGVVAFDEGVDAAGVVGIGLLVAGVYVPNVVSGMSAR